MGYKVDSETTEKRPVGSDGEEQATTDLDGEGLHVVWDMTHAGRIRTGTGVYAQNVTAALQKTFGVCVSTLIAPRPLDHRSSLPARAMRGAHQVMWTQFGLRAGLRRLKPDLLHAPAFVSTLVPPCPLVVTIHDMAYVRFPQHYSKPWLWYTRLLVPLAARRARAVIAVSEHARRDVLRYLRLPPKKVHVVLQGVDLQRFRPLSGLATEGVARRYGLDTPFILHVGNLAARKNIPTLLSAVFRLKRAHSWGARKVVLAGGVSPGLPGYADIEATVEALGLETDVVFLGHVPDDDLPAIYNLADAVVMPTLHEGFGVPVIEGMACGRPVIAADTSSIPEVAGDAAILVDPKDVDAWAGALSRVLSNRALRQEMAERGLARARGFTWENTARNTLAVYRHVLGNGSHSDSGGAASAGGGR